MAMNKETRHGALRNGPRWITTLIVFLGVMGSGLVAISVPNESDSSLHAFAAPAVQGVPANGRTAMMAPREPLSTDDFLVNGFNEKISSPLDSPRECQPERGITTDCTFN